MKILKGGENAYKLYRNINSKDPYSFGTVKYAETWANLMEIELESGRKLGDIADRTSHKADTEGITGAMYGFAVGILSEFWVYGEQLRKWHNIKTQFHGEGKEANKSGGVLNPAFLNIQPKS